MAETMLSPDDMKARYGRTPPGQIPFTTLHELLNDVAFSRHLGARDRVFMPFCLAPVPYVPPSGDVDEPLDVPMDTDVTSSQGL